MSNRLSKMAKHKTPTYDFTKGGKVYGRTERPMTVQEASDETWKIAYRVFTEVALEALEEDFSFGYYMRDQFIKSFSKIHEERAKTGVGARECLAKCEARQETEQLFER